LKSTNDTNALREGSWYNNCTVVLTIQTRITDELMVNGVTAGKFVNTATVTNDTMALGSQTATATQPVSIATEDNLSKGMDTYLGGTTFTFNMDINTNAEDLIYTAEEDKGTSKDTLEIMDVMGDKMSLATTKSDYFVVTDKDGNKLTLADSEEIGPNQYYMTQVESKTGTAYKIIVPDGMKLHIKYLVTVDAAVGEEVEISNKAYFNYDGLRDGTDKSIVDVTKVISKMQGSGHAVGQSPEFQIFKQDQFGNPIEGVTFKLYQVTLDSNGEEASATEVASVTTGEDGYAKFDTTLNLDDKAVYYFEETSAPAGYAMSTKKTYFYFTKQDNLNIAGATGIDYWEKIFEVTNEFTPASLTVPLTKTINGENLKNSNEFTFTLTKTGGPEGADVYSDKACTTPATTATATIAGSGTTKFDTLYFDAVGEYTFDLRENDLEAAATAEGFAKDNTVYTITVNVASGTEGFYVESAQYTNADDTKSGSLLDNETPVFNNTLTKNPVTVTLEATKKLELKQNGNGTATDTSARTIRAGEFTFKVVENGEEIATGKTKADFDSDGFAEIEFTSIQYDQNQLGPHYLTIYEVEGTDFTVTYSTVKFLATVVVEPVQGSTALTATVAYSTKNTSDLANGKPVFTNTYFNLNIPTGVRLDMLPYALIVIMATGFGTLMFVRRRRRRCR
jgi:pilin isopeptide linkage protein